jgi:hypothetical protein
MNWHVNKAQTQANSPAVPRKGVVQGMGLANQTSEWLQQHPVLAILLVSLLAVCINCYPIIFCGRSYVSPGIAGAEVYSWGPPLPGMADAPDMSAHGSDTVATMWWEVPAGFIESRSLLEQGEIPLWNRYGHSGDTFIGQAETMLGDPLQLIVIIGHGSAGAWDIKFLAAKFLFCAGFGLLILRLFGSPWSWIYAALAAYCGAFFYINNHPVFFVFCYAPWILLTALAWLDLRSEQHIRWGVAWLLVNFACFNAGHVEVAVVLIGGLNLAALAHALARSPTVASWSRVIGRMGLGTLLFLGLTAPVWMSFFAALDGAYSLHTEVRIRQFPLGALPGMFDDLFYLLLRPDDFRKASAPGASLFVLVGCLCAAWKWRQLKAEPFFWINSSAIVLWSGCIFGWVPAFVLAAIPLLNRVGHTHTDFSYLLIIHLTLQSVYGYKCLTQEKNFRRVVFLFYSAGVVFAGVVWVYAQTIAQQPVPWSYFLCAGAGALGAPLLFLYFKSNQRPISALGWAGIVVLGFLPNIRFGLYNFGSDALLMLPGPREVLNAPSQAIEKIMADKSGPFRVVGSVAWGDVAEFMGDYEAVYGLEDIRSLAPLSNGEYIKLVTTFPGISFGRQWRIGITNLTEAQPLLNLLNVKYLLTNPRNQVKAGSDFYIADRSDFLVLKNPKAWPRAFFSNLVATNISNDQFVQQLLADGQRPFVSLSPDEIKKQPALLLLLNNTPAIILPATHYRLLQNSTSFDVHAPSAGVVCLTEGQAKDFTATANLENKEVLTVNRAFKGIYLDKPGDYHVEFTYRPHLWRLACVIFWISIGGVLLAGLMGFLSNKKKATR